MILNLIKIVCTINVALSGMSSDAVIHAQKTCVVEYLQCMNRSTREEFIRCSRERRQEEI